MVTTSMRTKEKTTKTTTSKTTTMSAPPPTTRTTTKSEISTVTFGKLSTNLTTSKKSYFRVCKRYILLNRVLYH